MHSSFQYSREFDIEFLKTMKVSNKQNHFLYCLSALYIPLIAINYYCEETREQINTLLDIVKIEGAKLFLGICTFQLFMICLLAISIIGTYNRSIVDIPKNSKLSVSTHFEFFLVVISMWPVLWFAFFIHNDFFPLPIIATIMILLVAVLAELAVVFYNKFVFPIGFRLLKTHSLLYYLLFGLFWVVYFAFTIYFLNEHLYKYLGVPKG